MKVFAALTFVVFASAAPRMVEVRKGDSVEDIARRELGDPAAAGELRALNGLDGGAVAPGSRIAVPGRERERALSALSAARNAVNHQDAGTSEPGAQTRLADAEQLFASARYEDAARAADEAWKLATGRERAESTFTVEVKESGETRVTSRSGQPVRVEAQGVQKAIDPGMTVQIARGAEPAEPTALPQQPTLAAPADAARLSFKPNRQGQLGPVKLRWSAARGARGYEVEVVPEDGKRERLVLTSARPGLVLPHLPAGRYWWKVKALGEDALTSPPSDARSFELVAEQLKLEVRGTDWK